MNHNRRRLLLCSASTLLLPVHSALASSNYPNRPITFICPWPLGGTADLTMRALPGWLVAMNEQRLARFLNVPTLRDAGFNVVFNPPNGIAAPAGLDPLIQLKLRHALKKVITSSKFKQVCDSIHAPVMYQDADEYINYIQSDYEHQKNLIQKLNLKEQMRNT